MDDLGVAKILNDPLEIGVYLSSVEKFETELNLSQDEESDLVPYHICNVNMFTQDIALSPGQEQNVMEFDPTLPIKVENLRKNISFEESLVRVHGKGLLIMKIPKAVNFINTRGMDRFTPNPKHSSGVYLRKVEALPHEDASVRDAYLMDFSEKGVAIRVNDSRCPQIEAGDRVQIRLNADYAYLDKINGFITYKKYIREHPEHPAFSKVGIRLEKGLPLEKTQEVYS